MSLYLLSLLILIIATNVAMVLRRPAKVFEYPYFMASTMAVFILPQAFALIKFPGGVRDAEIADVILLCILCLLCCTLGYRIPAVRSISQSINHPVNPDKIFHVGIAYVIIGIAGFVFIPLEGVRFASRGGLTGIATIYLFFANLALPGFAICLNHVRKRVTPFRVLMLVISSWSPLLSLYMGRREPTIVCLLIIAMTAYFNKRKAPSRFAIMAAIIFSALAIPATGVYRSLMSTGELGEVRRIDLWQNFKDFVGNESILELRNAAAVVESARVSKDYGLGAAYWNMVVYRFVPAQFVGTRTKEALLVGTTVDKIYTNELATNYDIPSGSTITGMGDSYTQFGWFGCLFFALVAILFRSIWTAALHPDAIFAQLFYIMICSTAMRTITHQTVDFIPGVIYQLVFLGVGYLYARLDLPRIHPSSRRIQPTKSASPFSRNR